MGDDLLSKELLGSLELNRIYQMDCLEGIKLIPNNSIDLIIVDPPYFEIKGEFDFVFKNEDHYLDFIERCLIQFSRVLKSTGTLYMYCSQQMGAYIDLMLRKYFEIKNRIIWYRKGGLSPIKKFKLSHEPLYYCVKDINNHILNPEDIRIKSKYADKDKRLNPKGKVPDDVWEIPNLVGKKKEKVDHPTQKPLAICERMIKASSNEGSIILIPFVGSGSECVMAKHLKRRFIGFEINPNYIEIANMRIESTYNELDDEKLINKIQ